MLVFTTRKDYFQGKYPEFVIESIPSSIELKSKEQKYLCDQLKIKAPFLSVHRKAEKKAFYTVYEAKS